MTANAKAPTMMNPHKEELDAEEVGLMNMLSMGSTDEVAGARLGLSLRTVRRRLRSAFKKLGATSRFQAGYLFANTKQSSMTRSSGTHRNQDEERWDGWA